MVPECRKVIVHIIHCWTGNTTCISFELFIPNLVSPFQIPINFNAQLKPKDNFEKKKQQILNDAKCIAARFIHEALMVSYLELIKQRCFTWLH